MQALSPALALVALFSQRVVVQGSSTCPNPAEVAERIIPLLPAERGFPVRTVVRLDDGGTPSEVEVRLEGEGDRAPLASRRLPRSGSCGELAEAVAVVAASWAGRYDTPSPQELAPWESPQPAADIRHDGSYARGETGFYRLSFGVGGGVSAASAGGLTPHGGVELTAASRATRWFGRLMVAGSGERWLALDAGKASWWRLLAVPSFGRTWGESLFFEASAGPAIAAVFVRGGGFSPNARDVSLDLGVSPAVRLGYRIDRSVRATVWIGVQAIAWIRPHTVSVEKSTNDAAIPRLDVLFSFGTTFAFGR